MNSFISDPDKKTLTQLVKLLNKKFSLVENEADVKKENESYPVSITQTKDTKIIAGYNCNKVHVKVNDDSGTEYDVYYTKELNIKNPNFANPFSDLDGVLMEYQMKKKFKPDNIYYKFNTSKKIATKLKEIL